MSKSVWIMALVGVALVLLVVGMLISTHGFRMSSSIDGDRVAKNAAPTTGNALGQAWDVKQPAAPLAQQAAPGGAPAAGAESAATSRRIVFTAQIQLTVTDLDAAQKALRDLIAEHKGYVAGSEVASHTGTRRSGHWTVRVPVPQFQPFVDAAVRLGVPVRNQTEAQDVTDEFVDLSARLRNKQAEEKKLLELQEKYARTLEELRTHNQDLFRVRGEIELLQSRLQKLEKLTELSTVTVTMGEEKPFVPTNAPEPTSFGETVGRTFRGSVDLLVIAGKGVVLGGAALAPWLPLLGLVAGGVWLAVRRRKRGQRAPGD